MDSLQSYGQENASHATNAYTISSIYHGGALKIGALRTLATIWKSILGAKPRLIASHLDIVRACAFEFAKVSK
jgi:hypothetical protein